MKSILVTGSAGFIGANLVLRLFKELGAGEQTGAGESAGEQNGVQARIVGMDNLNAYYDPSLKEYRLKTIEAAVPAGLRGCLRSTGSISW